MRLSQNFTLDEMTISASAARMGIPNTPNPKELDNLRLVCEALEYIRHLLGDHPLVVHSGYRSPTVNALVGGVPTSAHTQGLACDFVCPEYGSPFKIAQTIVASGLDFDQCIREFGWVHIAVSEDGIGRRESLTKRSAATPYEQGINA